MSETQRIPINNDAQAYHDVAMLYGEAHKTALNAARADDGEVLCVIECDGGSRYEVIVYKSGSILVANANKQLGEDDAAYPLKPGKQVIIAKSGAFYSDSDMSDSPERQITIGNTLLKDVGTEARVHLIAIDSNPMVHTYVRAEQRYTVNR